LRIIFHKQATVDAPEPVAEDATDKKEPAAVTASDGDKMDTGTATADVAAASAPGLVDAKSAASEPLESKSEAAAEEKPAADSDEATSGNKRGSPAKDDEEPKEKKVAVAAPSCEGCRYDLGNQQGHEGPHGCGGDPSADQHEGAISF
jgi:hypothetical protein